MGSLEVVIKGISNDDIKLIERGDMLSYRQRFPSYKGLGPPFPSPYIGVHSANARWEGAFHYHYLLLFHVVVYPYQRRYD